MPYSPAAINAANARYGFTSPPGIRVSTRIADPEPTTRNPHVRLSRPQANVVGAHDPAAKRLYELMFGAKNTANSRPHAIWPARYDRNTSVSPANADVPLRHSDE